MANNALALFIPLTLFLGRSVAFPQDEPAKFNFQTENPLIKTCLKNSGSSTAYKRITVAFGELSACFNTNSTLRNESDTGWEEDRACLNLIIDPVLSCLTGSRKQNRVFLDKLANEIIQMKCTFDQIQDWTETEKDGYQSSNLCLRNQIKSVIDCNAPFFRKSIILSDYDARECAQLSRSKICIMEIMRTCHAGPRLVDVADMVYKVAYDVNKCTENTSSENENEI